MSPTQENAILIETARTRDRAKALLDELQSTKAELDHRLDASRSEDAMRVVTGKTALDNAIESSKRMLDQLDRSLARVGAAAESSAGLDASAAARHRDEHDNAPTINIAAIGAALTARANRPIPTT